MNKDFYRLSIEAFRHGVKAANPGKCLKEAIKENPIQTPNGGKYIVVSIGKAACSLMETAIDILPPKREKQLLVVTNYQNYKPIIGSEIITAGHPIPDKNGIKASNRVIEILKNATKNDTLIILISGGSSALLPAPVKGLNLNDKIQINQLLLSSDLNIREINLIRQSMSTLKGGGFTKIASPIPINSFILSDVIGDDLRVIASGPTVSPIGNIEEAYELLVKNNLYSKLSLKLQDFFKSKTRSIFTDNKLNQNILIGNNRKSVVAMAKSVNAEVIPYPIVGNVRTATQKIFDEINIRRKMKYVALAFGGETTVNVSGNGTGGRNQELALRVAEKLFNQKLKGKWSFLSGGTDGQDGPTDAAGGIVDQDTIKKLYDNNMSVEKLLNNNDSNSALKFTNELLVTGNTGTNVADLQLFLWKNT
jgi:hydroxypyruvate reductase